MKLKRSDTKATPKVVDGYAKLAVEVVMRQVALMEVSPDGTWKRAKWMDRGVSLRRLSKGAYLLVLPGPTLKQVSIMPSDLRTFASVNAHQCFPGLSDMNYLIQLSSRRNKPVDGAFALVAVEQVP